MALLHDFLHLFYPELCLACSSALFQHEKLVCTRCLARLPYTAYESMQANKTEKLFWGRVPLHKASSLFFFTKGSRIQVLMHALKYQGRKDVGVFLGERMFYRLQEVNWLDDIDVLIPVPLHPNKRKKRGYNQSELIAQGLSSSSGIPHDYQSLQRVKFTETQTKKSRIERFENMQDVFEIKDFEAIRGKRVLLIDDIITTGATLEACAIVLLDSGAASVSVATLACTFT